MSGLIIGEGAASDLSSILTEFEDPVLVVTGDRSFAVSGAEERIRPQMTGRVWKRYAVRSRLPGFEAARDGISSLDGLNPGVVLAVGGGAVIDTAKLIALTLNNDDVDRDPTCSDGLIDAVKLVAIPTTSGSGSERTPFAVAYRGANKVSVAHLSLTPAYAVVDPTLTYSMSPELTASSGLDALAHAIESAWAASATEESVELSIEALTKVWASLEDAVYRPTPSNRRLMAEASTVAGSAIAVARTTASHALSYYLTAVHNVPHGVAAAMTLGPVLVFNEAVDVSNVSGTRSPAQIRIAIARVCEVLGADDGEAARLVLQLKMKSLGVPATLGQLGLTEPGGIQRMVASVNEERLSNNPRTITPNDLKEILLQVS